MDLARARDRALSCNFRRSWRVLTVFKDLSYFSADRGLELVASEFSLATGSWVRESIEGLVEGGLTPFKEMIWINRLLIGVLKFENYFK